MHRTSLSPVVFRELLRERAARWRVFGVHGDAIVCEQLDGFSQNLEDAIGRGSEIGARVDVLREWPKEQEGDRGDFKRALGSPDAESIIQLLSNAKSSKIPRLPVILFQ